MAVVMSLGGPSALSKVVPLHVGGARPSARVHLLGVMRATSYLGADLLPRGRKARAILGYLCLHPGERTSRSRLAAMLWDRVPDQQARANLRQALRELTVSLGPLADEIIVADIETVKLEARSCWIDAVAMLAAEPQAASSRGDLASLCVGELLEDVCGVSPAFDQWLLAERARFSSRLTTLLEGELRDLCQSGGGAERRVDLSRRILAFDATHEGASRTLMRALADRGERAQALREYERCRAALRRALDVEPSSETRALHLAIKAFSGDTRQDAGATALAASTASQTPIAARLRVGVLPLHHDGSARAEGLAFSFGQEIAAALARFRWFDVIAPISLPRAPTADPIGSLGGKNWHYAVEGTFAMRGSMLEISVRLLDIEHEARPVWSDRFQIASDALDQLYDRVVAPVVARIDPVILHIEGQPRRPQRSGATALVLKAIPLLHSLERDKYEEAGRLIGQALRADPDNAKAATWAAYWHAFNVGQGWAENPAESCAKAQELALSAIKMDPENAEAHGLYAHICAFLDKDFESAVHHFERALRLNPNLATIWAMSAPTYCYIGQPDRALAHMRRYRELAPLDPHALFWEGVDTIAYMFKGDYQSAAKVGRRAVKGNPEFSNDYKPLIAALGHLGRREEAASYIAKLLALEPHFTVKKFGETYPFQQSDDRERYMRGLALAGVPVA